MSCILNTNQYKKQTQNLFQFPGMLHLTLIDNQKRDYLLFMENKFNRRIQSYKINISRQNWRNWLGIYQWRNTTQLPIPNIYYIVINHQDNQSIEFQVFGQYFPHRIYNFIDIPLKQTLYLIKESLIALERLFSKFGGFQLNSRMIGITQNRKCKVWFNEQFQLNTQRKLQIDEKGMILQLIDIVSFYTVKENKSRELFSGLKQVHKFIQANKYIDSFICKARMSIPFRFTFDPKDQIVDEIRESVNSSDSSFAKSEKQQSENRFFQKKLKQKNHKKTSVRGQNQTKKIMSHEKMKRTSNMGLLFLQYGRQVSQPEDYLDEKYDLQQPSTPDCKPINASKANFNIFKSDSNPNNQQKNEKYINSRRKSLFKYSNLSPKKVNSKKINKTINHERVRLFQEPNIIVMNEQQNNEGFINQTIQKNGWQNCIKGLISKNTQQIKKSITIGNSLDLGSKIQLIKLGAYGRSIGYKYAAVRPIKLEFMIIFFDLIQYIINICLQV